MAKKKIDLEKVIADQKSYDDESKSVIQNIVFARNEIDKLDSMKRTEGWKIMNQKIREELQLRIMDLVEDDIKVQTLIALLKVTDTKRRSKILQQEIDKILPEE